MSATLIKSLYTAFSKGDVPAVLAAFDPAIRWCEAENYYLSDRNPYIGPAAIAEGVFTRLITDVPNFSLAPSNFIDAGDTVVVEGRYRGTFKATGKSFDTQFAHVWQLKNGKVVRFQQYTDTKQWAQARA
ncbi:MAG: nuclear transport factor 2 family protein [Phycisphaeraceae bacterium]|nr:nuclear transport factor 2 family protein [Phycisphaeraceae bacterium]